MQNCSENEKCERVCVRCAAECVARCDVAALEALLSDGRLQGDLFWVPVNDLDLMRHSDSIIIQVDEILSKGIIQKGNDLSTGAKLMSKF